MRIKILVIGAALAAVVGGGSASAALQNQLNVDILHSKAGKPATIKVFATNEDSAGKVPERISQVILKSKTAKVNANAVPKCTGTFPGPTENSAPISPSCPSKSLIGSGTATVLAGNAGQPVPPQGGSNYIEAKLKIYNYKKSAGDKATFLIEAISQQPIQDATIYTVVHYKSNTLTANIPGPASIPANLAQFYPGVNFSIIKFQATINSKKTKLIALKPGNINAELTVVRE